MGVMFCLVMILKIKFKTVVILLQSGRNCNKKVYFVFSRPHPDPSPNEFGEGVWVIARKLFVGPMKQSRVEVKPIRRFCMFEL